MQISRPLNFQLVYKKGEVTTKDGYPDIVKQPELPVVTSGISIDNSDNVWVATQKRQMTDSEKQLVEMDIIRGSGTVTRNASNSDDLRSLYETDLFLLEIFNREGILIGQHPIRH